MITLTGMPTASSRAGRAAAREGGGGGVTGEENCAAAGRGHGRNGVPRTGTWSLHFIADLIGTYL